MGTYLTANTKSQTYELSIHGYQEISYVDLTAGDKSNTDKYLKQTDLSMSASVKPSANKSHSFINYHCSIDFNVSMTFDLPNFLSKPQPNLTLFKKADEFSFELSNLNDTLIQIFQEMDCCGISDEYNKTIVPIFRYLASSKDHTTCGDSPNLPADSCGGDSNFMKDVLKTVKDITKVYTAIEPLFCLISPIPGNPWLPIDFNWMAPILPYLQSFQQLMDKIMSGSLFDLIIDPVKNINRSIQNCTQTQTRRSITYLNKIHDQKTSDNIIKLMKKIEDAKDDIKNSTDNNQSLLSEKDSLTKSLQDEASKAELNKKIYKIMNSSSPVKNIPPNKSMEKYKLQQIRNPGDGICRCLFQLSGMEVKLPKIPKAKIHILPSTFKQSHNIHTNDLLKFVNHTAYDITYKDINASMIDSSSHEKIQFTDSLVTDFNFINQFQTYMDDDGTKDYYTESIISDLDSSDINPETSDISLTDFNDRFNDNLPIFQFDYTDKRKYVNETIQSFNPYLDSDLSLTGVSKDGNDKASVIIDTNKKIIDRIDELQESENKYIDKKNELEVKDYNNWRKYKIQADAKLRELNLSKADDFRWNNIKTLKQRNLYLDIFGSYLKPDINIDLEDTRIRHKLFLYSDIQDTDMYSIALQYVEDRLNITFFDDISGDDYKTYAQNEIHNTYLKIEDMVTNYGLHFSSLDDITTNIKNKVDSIKNNNYDQYLADYKALNKMPFGNIFLEKLANSEPDAFIRSGIILLDDATGDGILSNIESELINNIPDINISGTQYNLLYYNIKILQTESYKLTLFKIIEENVAYDFFLTYYPKIECNCATVICKLLQWIVDFLLYYINMFLGWLIQMLLEWLIPKWLRALIDLIIYKLKCIMEIVYMGDSMDLIDKVYKDLLEKLKYRVNNYPYKNCVDNALSDALAALRASEDQLPTDPNNTTNTNSLPTDAEKDALSEHHVKIEFVDINKSTIRVCTKSQFSTAGLAITFDVGAEIQSILLSDATIPGDSTSIELITRTDLVYIKQKIYLMDLPLDKIVSGKLKATVKSFKSFADEQIVYDTAILTIVDFVDSLSQRLILSDYKTADLNTFLETDKETLKIDFNIATLDSIGDAGTNLDLIKNYIQDITLFDTPPAGVPSLPSIVLTGTDLVDLVYYSKDSELFSLIVDCTNFFPTSRNINGIITTLPIYSGTAQTAVNDIYCKGNDGILTDQSSGGVVDAPSTFSDSIIYAKGVTVPNTTTMTSQDLMQHVMQVRQEKPLIFNCENSIGNGTAANINKVNTDFHDTWVDLGLI